jgi:hypothetical protein
MWATQKGANRAAQKGVCSCSNADFDRCSKEPYGGRKCSMQFSRCQTDALQTLETLRCNSFGRATHVSRMNMADGSTDAQCGRTGLSLQGRHPTVVAARCFVAA